MRRLATLAAGVVLLALAGCAGATSGISALQVPAGPDDKLVGGAEVLRVAPGSVRLLADTGDFAFYAAVPDNPAERGVCVIIVEVEASGASSGCGGTGREPVELGTAGVWAKLVQDNYDAGKDLAEGWEQLHPNLLVRGL